MLAGIPVRDQDVLELALLLRKAGIEATAETLEKAYDLETKVLALTILDREAILRALDDPPEMAASDVPVARSGENPGYHRGMHDVRSSGIPDTPDPHS
jgi:hypothetical protein